MTDLTYHQRSRDVIPNTAKNIMKIKKKDQYQYSKQKINAEIYLKKKKIKRENMEETDTIICLKIANRCITINTLKLKQKFAMILYIQIFNIIKHPKIMNIVHAYL